MYDIIILAVGKIKEKYFEEAIQEYLKRLRPYARVVIHELPPESFGKGDIERTKNIEGDKILKFLEKQKNAKVIVMDEQGKNFTSHEFSSFLSREHEQLVFVIGGSLGLSDEVLSRADYKLSLSQMTFTHEMARLFLCEQIYRAITIEKGKTYHY